MNNDELQAKLVMALKTRESAELFAQCIQDVLQNTYTVKQTLSEKIKSTFPAQLHLVLMDMLSFLNVDLSDAQKIIESLKLIADTTRKIQYITLTTALPPTDSLLEFILSQTQDLLNQSMLLDITYDPTIYGGALISHNGTYRDYSLRKQLNSLQQT